MAHDLLYALWFFLPAGAGNLAPLLVTRFPLLKHWTKPLDGGARYRGQRLLGDSKTWRGLVCGSLAGLLTFMAQQTLAPHLGSFSAYLETAGYMDLSVILGLLLGAGALIGDAVKSFFKRRVGVEPSKSWFPFDQLDYIIGGCLFAAPLVILPIKIYLLVLVVWFIIHLAFSYLGYLLHYKKTPI